MNYEEMNSTTYHGLCGESHKPVVLVDQRLVSMLLSTERPTHVFGTPHNAAALII